MVQNSSKELQDLTSVNTFYLSLLEKGLGHGVPVPAEVAKTAEAKEAAPDAARVLKNWLALLDLATTPPLVRDALKTLPSFDAAHSLLRYFTTKASVRSGDRDKTDCIITHLFRHPAGVPPAWHRPEVDTSYEIISQSALAFEGELYRVLGEVEHQSMSDDQVRLLREFEFLYQELEEFRHFDQIMDSGIVQRVREMKQSLGKAFYHPDSLANIASWNDIFGRKFDLLFHDATKQIKTFAEKVQREGGSILSRVEGDITVQQLSEIETGELLAEDYQSAQDEFRKVSRFQKVVDKRPARPAPARPVASAPAEPAPQAPAPRPAIPPASPEAGVVAQPLAAPVSAPPAQAPPPPRPSAPAVSGQQVQAEVLAVPPSQAVHNSVQEGKIHSARQQIKEHVRTAKEPQPANVVPIKKAKLILSPAEVEAFRADFEGEKSFRANYASVTMTIVAYLSRMIVEADEYNQKAGSAYLWKPHADALTYLLTTLDRVNMEAEQLMAVARARGLADKATSLKASLDKLKDYAKTVSQTLQAAEQNTSGQSS
ncbi:MAG TPA: hypothetical protein VKE93_01660 [Candidatus Angelobacter sp.]|nr:hypothetical protein [Candidatus Angelobacter sp.]